MLHSEPYCRYQGDKNKKNCQSQYIILILNDPLTSIALKPSNKSKYKTLLKINNQKFIRPKTNKTFD